MSFSLNSRVVRDVIVVGLTGRVTVGESVLLVRKTVREFLEQGFSMFVLNLEGVSYIDSCGLGELVATYTSVCKRGGRVSLLNPSRRARDLLRITQLSTVFAIFDDESTAVQALSAKAAGQTSE